MHTTLVRFLARCLIPCLLLTHWQAVTHAFEHARPAGTGQHAHHTAEAHADGDGGHNHHTADDDAQCPLFHLAQLLANGAQPHGASCAQLALTPPHLSPATGSLSDQRSPQPGARDPPPSA